ncbi:MAG: LLM class flavin-dependent oxidoreductase [Deltaproteobacteria bacterium]|nr:LLM class flavin-dependent oxidoreductase [Deltaproteobacteria bacterium]
MPKLECYVMGAESLLAQCAQILRDRGHQILGVITDSRDLTRWAEGEGLEVVAPGKGLADRLREHDVFFSIANLRIVPDSVLAKAKRGAVNFHDGPLPRYAGLNAPNWALMNQESTHGVTWHRIEGGVDEGRMLARREVEVQPLMTAFELNAACYAAAIASFPEVLDRLEADDERKGLGEKQDLSERTYFAKDDRPAHMGVIRWRDQDATEIVALVRALDYGAKYPSPLLFAKVVDTTGRVLLVREAATSAGKGRPGEVLEADDDGAVVASKQGAVRITRLTDLVGRPVSPATLAGQELGTLDEETLTRLTQKNAQVVPNEGFWTRRLEALQPLELAAIGHSESDAKPAQIALEAAGLEGDRWVAAIALGLARLAGADVGHVGYRGAALDELLSSDGAFFAGAVPLRVQAEGTASEAAEVLAGERAKLDEKLTYPTDLIARRPALEGHDVHRMAIVIAPRATSLVGGSAVTLAAGTLHYDATRVDESAAAELSRRLGVLLAAFATDASGPANALPLLSEEERERLLRGLNATEVDYEQATMHGLFEAQVDRTPDKDALVHEGARLSYRALDEQANQVAHVLRGAGVGKDDVVGLCCHRSLDLVVGALGILKAGGAYLPLDPDYPVERLAMMLEDSGAKVLVTHGEAKGALSHSGETVVLGEDSRIGAASTTRLDGGASPEDLAYVIYTSGSTGRPKGVMVEHRNAANFFVGMDSRVPHGGDDTWLAVTSLSFDISVLELFWTLARGFTVAVHRERERVLPGSNREMAFGLFYWGNDDKESARKYELLIEGAKLGDRVGFTSLWTPERHFHAFGGPYPNPAVTGAAVAGMTENLDIRAGSVVSPLHHPARIAEEWAVIDNLTGGRTGLAFASGWQPDDFILRPENTPPKNKPAMLDSIDVVRRLWRGEAVAFPKEDGTMHEVVTQPRPVSKELNVWVTTAGNPETYRNAGEKKAHVLTHLLGQSLEELEEKIAVYRDALREAGANPDEYKVTLMLHTYLDADKETAREIAREPMKDYLRSAAGLIKQYAWAFPAFKKPEGVTNPFEIDLGSLGHDEMEAILEFAFMRYFEDSGLFGTVEDAVARVEQLKSIGVDEVACLIDYGIPVPKVLESIRRVGKVIERTAKPKDEGAREDWSVGATIERLGVTHMQCTPSMARLMTLDDRTRGSLRRLRQLLIGGEALPGALVSELRSLTDAKIENMYGPTETTIWSSTHDTSKDPTPQDITPIGTPIANTQLYVLDAQQQPVPEGIPGELWIGGDGVTRGYLHRPELTAERFVSDPFRGVDGARMYRTGDLVRRRKDGNIDFIGRVDHQVKLRGYRIELGEIEARLNELPTVREAVVVAREDTPGDKRLVAYMTTDGVTEEEALRTHLGGSLPDYMVPSHFVFLDAFPLTPNKKVDRKKLPRPDKVRKRTEPAEYVAPTSATEKTIADVWSKILGVEKIGSKESFFELGGHSLLAVQAHRELKQALGVEMAITDIFQYPTLGALASHLDDRGQATKVLDKTAARAAARREAMRRRRGR